MHQGNWAGTGLISAVEDEDQYRMNSCANPVVGWLSRLRERYSPSGSLRWYALSGSIWSVIGSLVSRIFTLASAVVIARIIGKVGYGKWGLILQTVTLFGRFAIIGVVQTGTKHIAELRKTDPNRAGRSISLVLIFGLIFSLVMGVCCVVLAPTVAENLFGVSELAFPLALGGLMLVAMVMTQALQGALAGFMAFRSIASSNLVQGITLIALVWPLTANFGLVGVVVTMTLSWMGGGLFCLAVLIKQCHLYRIPLGFHGIWSERKILWNYTTPGMLIAVVMGPAMLLSQAIVAHIPSGLAGLGGFNAASRWRMVVLFVPIAVRRVTLSILSEMWGRRDYRRLVKALWTNVGMVGGVAFAVAVPVMLLSPWIMSMYGASFRSDWDLLVLLAAAAVFQAINDVVTQVAMCAEKVWWTFFIHVIWGAQLLGCTYLLVPFWGVRGLVWAWVATTIVHMLLNILAATVIIKRLSMVEKVQRDQ